MAVISSLKGVEKVACSQLTFAMSTGHRGYVPAGKLEPYQIVPPEEKLRGQAGPREDSRHPTLEPTAALVAAVPTGTQVSVGVQGGLSGAGL